MKNMSLTTILEQEAFLKQLRRAAQLSISHNKESGFIAYCDEQLAHPIINQAVLGLDMSITSDMTQGATHKPGKGSFIPMHHYRLVDVHFHPPRTHLHPSLNDIHESLVARQANMNLRYTSGIERDVYADEEEKTIVGSAIDIPHPVSIIGLAHDNPETIELLVYQWITENPMSLDTFSQYVVDFCQKTYGETYDPGFIELIGIPTKFTSTKRVVDFMNGSSYAQAVSVNVRNGTLSSKDLQKLSGFSVVQTKFFPEEYDYPKMDEDYF